MIACEYHFLSIEDDVTSLWKTNNSNFSSRIDFVNWSYLFRSKEKNETQKMRICEHVLCVDEMQLLRIVFERFLKFRFIVLISTLKISSLSCHKYKKSIEKFIFFQQNSIIISKNHSALYSSLLKVFVSIWILFEILFFLFILLLDILNQIWLLRRFLALLHIMLKT
jgi:hypothetical protein